ncbi:class II aldolase/adducin family protein [Persephonella sp.]
MNKEIIKEIIFTGKVLYSEGLVNSHAGNISVREGDHLYITKTGKMLGFLTEEDIVKLPIHYETVKDKIASSELIVHREIYKKTDARAVIHAHPVYALIITFFLEDKFIPIDNEGKLFIGEVPIIEVKNASGSKELAETLSKTFRNTDSKIILVKKHGSFVISDSLNYALKLTSDLEFCSKIYYMVNKR